jgi:uncharacterized protein (TIGR02646 family)
MIPIKRSAEPKILVQNATKWSDEYLKIRALWETAFNKDEKKKYKLEKDKAEGKYNQPSIKEALNAMHNDGKCAFCESLIKHVAYANIEHFRPKDIFPDLCFSWDNLLLACGICNGVQYKSSKFPLNPDGSAIYIDPSLDLISEHFEFIFEEVNSLEFIAVVKPISNRGKVTEAEIGLNRIDLVKARTQFLSPYYISIALLAQNGNVEAKKLLNCACNPSFQYSAFAKALWEKYVNEPLP